MRAWALQTIEPTPLGDAHLDHCLACRNCETACPAGVKYGELLVASRGRQRERRGARVGQRAIEWASTRPTLLAATLATYRRLHRWLPARVRLLPRPPLLGSNAAAGGAAERLTRTERVTLFKGCVARSYEHTLRDAVVRLCTAVGVDVVESAGQHCCGSLHAHAGNLTGAQRLASRNRLAFGSLAQDFNAAGSAESAGPSTTVLTLASGCHQAVSDALGAPKQAMDAIAFIEARARPLRWRPCRQRVALHVPCTQRSVPGSVAALRRLLARVPGLEVVELDAGFGCCGAAGAQMLTDPMRANDYRRPLLAQLQEARATRLLSANIGCRLHFANATDRVVEHPLEFLARLLDDDRPVAAPATHVLDVPSRT